MENNQIFETLKRIELKIDSMNAPSEKEYYPVKEVLDLLGISRTTFDRHKNAGKIQTCYLGGLVKVHLSELKRIQKEGFK